MTPHGQRALRLERLGLWRRAARCWLAEMDACVDAERREWLVRRREVCLARAHAPTQEQRRRQYCPPLPQ